MRWRVAPAETRAWLSAFRARPAFAFSFWRLNGPFGQRIALRRRFVPGQQDKVIDEGEQKFLQTFFAQFVNLPPNQKDFSRELELTAKELGVAGICAVNPDVQFTGRMFCFTGLDAATE